MLARIKISTKIIIAFAACFICFGISAYVSYQGMQNASSSFKSFGKLAQETTLIGQVQANMLQTRMGVNEFLNTHDDRYMQEFTSRLDRTKQLISNLESYLHDEESLKHVDKIKTEIEDFSSDFDGLQQKIHEFDLALNETMRTQELSALNALESLLKKAHSSGDANVEYYAALLLEKFLFTKISVSNYLQDSAKHSLAANRHFSEILPETEQNLFAVLTTNDQKKLFSDYENERTNYAKEFEHVVTLLKEQNELVRHLSYLGEDISKELEEIKYTAIEQQNVLVPELQKSKEKTVSAILTASVVAIVIGVAFAIWVRHSILTGIVKVKVVSTHLSEGNLAIKIENDSGDELGELLNDMQVTVVSLHEIISQVSMSSSSAGVMSEELSQITHTTNDSAQALKMEMQGIATAIEQLSASTLEISTSAQGTSEFTQQATVNSEDSLNVVSQTLDDIQSIEKEMTSSVELIQGLYQESINIGSILETIRGVAEQTNLLALNAAIEAARAGDQGRGFAVVADEVRTLAQRTQDATLQIETLIGSLQSGAEKATNAINSSHERVVHTSESAGSATQKLQAIKSSISELNELNLQIAAAVEEQSLVTNNVSSSVQETNEISTQTTESVAHISTAANELTEVAQNLDEQVKRFKL
ncbi:HAMP domain-containing methyl-accepting chemotaxis protein [Vibrio atypicus]|uniref:HAMP domain-containing methyl-accepting chemotaxis protein n=1 Tax=Vibrio atypicus TaxID=558271 RepID=UPI003736A9F6